LFSGRSIAIFQWEMLENKTKDPMGEGVSRFDYLPYPPENRHPKFYFFKYKRLCYYLSWR
jgi:hypothetical protein